MPCSMHSPPPTLPPHNLPSIVCHVQTRCLQNQRKKSLTSRPCISCYSLLISLLLIRTNRGLQGWDGRSTHHSPPRFGMVARGWTCPQGQPTLVEWWEGVRPTRPRIEGSREPTLTKMANQPRHTHGVYAELSSTVPVQHARIPTER